MDGWNSASAGHAPDNKRLVNNEGWHLWLGNMRLGVYTYASVNGQIVVTPVREHLYLAGRRVEPSDRIGSNLSGGLRLLPYGDELHPPNVPNARTKFATYERDIDGWDYADQRYYLGAIGRFATEDPGPMLADNPSSFNRYSYGWNDPVNTVDVNGTLPGALIYEGGCDSRILGGLDMAICLMGQGSAGGSLSPLMAAAAMFDSTPGVSWAWSGTDWGSTYLRAHL
jgi:RHS repeat-associated protein